MYIYYVCRLRTYSGSPIGTTYTVSVYPTESEEEKVFPDKASTITMIIWVAESFPPLVDIRPHFVLHKQSRAFNRDIKFQVQV